MKQKVLLLLVLALGMCGTAGIAQEKEYKVEDDGFEWYKVTRTVNGQKKYGAEDRNGNMIVPTEYDRIWYRSDENPLLEGFGPLKGGFRAWYSKSGKCVIPYSRGYTWIQKRDDNEFGTYYTFEKSDGGGICDRTGKEVVSVKADSLLSISISSVIINEKVHYFIPFMVTKNGEQYKGIADANGRIIVPAEQKDFGTAFDLVKSRLTTTNNPLEGNRHETQAEAEGRSQGAQNNLDAGQQQQQSGGTTTVVVEQHGPIQVWVACGGCQFEPGRCTYCHGSGWGYNDRLCPRCGGNGKCTICGGNGGHYEVQYR